jgi:hypothetical protein
MSSRFVAEKATAPVISAETNQCTFQKLEKEDQLVDAPNMIGTIPRWFNCTATAENSESTAPRVMPNQCRSAD